MKFIKQIHRIAITVRLDKPVTAKRAIELVRKSMAGEKNCEVIRQCDPTKMIIKNISYI